MSRNMKRNTSGIMSDDAKINQEELHQPEDKELTPEALAEAVEEVAEKSDEVGRQIEELTAALQRERADFINFKKRIERENEIAKVRISGDVLAKFLPVIDDFERAVLAMPADAQESDWLKGIQMIQRKFHNLIEAEGVEVINPVGEPFDPNYHEAIGADEPTDEIPSEHVTVVLQKGYKLGERILRPAIVRVAS